MSMVHETCRMSSLKETSPVTSLQTLLSQTRDLLSLITDEQYTKCTASTQSGTGSHIRHTLDHIQALLAGRNGNPIDYDTRERNTTVERSRMSAIDAIDLLIKDLSSLSDQDLNKTVELHLLLSPFHPRYRTTSTIGRELAFVMHHTIHHNAIIAMLLRNLEIDIPDFFGFAPATIEVLS